MSCVLLNYDFTKAFDSVSHGILLRKILALQFAIGFVKWLENYLKDRSQQIRVNGVLSTFRQVTSGVPQGSLLGPYLFVLYCFDHTPKCDDTLILQYADDVYQVVPVKNRMSTVALKLLESGVGINGLWRTAYY